jgi:HEAT repeat protein
MVRSDPEFVDSLIGAFREKSMEVNVEAVEALVWLGAPVLPQLLQALGDPDPGVRFHAAKALGEIGNRRAVEPLIRVLGDASPGVRWGAAEALGAIGDRRAVEALMPRLQDEHPDVRWLTARALGALGDRRAVAPLLRCLGRDDDDWLQWAAVRALGEVGDGRAVAGLVGMLGHPAWHLRAEAAESLGQIGGRRVLEPLVQAWMVEEDERVRERLEEALQELRWRR